MRRVVFGWINVLCADRQLNDGFGNFLENSRNK